MKAAYIEKVGPPENIRYGDLPVPALGKGDVLVKVSAVCVNPVDTYIRSGQFPIDLSFPFIVGRDMAGVVEAVGSAVTRFQPGARVWCNNQGHHGRQGTFAQYVAVDEGLLYSLPAGVDDQEAVAFVHSGLTACLGLRRADLRSGQSLLVNGGSGNVGSAVLQLARARGARVLATAVSTERLAWCQTLGAERVVNYKTGDVDCAVAEFAPGGVDVYWDTSGRPDFEQAVARLSRRGRVIVMAGLTAQPPFPVGPFYVKDCVLHGFAVTNASEAELQVAADEINQWLAQGRVRVRIDRVLPLSEAAQAHRLVEDHVSLAGKIVLTPLKARGRPRGGRCAARCHYEGPGQGVHRNFSNPLLSGQHDDGEREVNCPAPAVGTDAEEVHADVGLERLADAVDVTGVGERGGQERLQGHLLLEERHPHAPQAGVVAQAGQFLQEQCPDVRRVTQPLHAVVRPGLFGAAGEHVHDGHPRGR